MATRKYLSLERLADYDELIKAEIKSGDESTLSSAKSYADTKVSNITNGDIIVKEAEHSTSADSATNADHSVSSDSATKATQDADGNIITETYETKEDAQLKYDTITAAKADWNQNDETAIDYIKNRPFYEGDLEEYYVLEELTIEDDHDLNSGSHAIFKSFLEVGKTYEVIFDGNSYLVECINGDNGMTIGDTSLQEYPFYLFDFTFLTSLKFVPRETPLTISIKVRTQEIKKIERKFVDGIAGMDVEGKIFSYNGSNYIAQNGAEIFNDYLNNIAIGSCSHAEGVRTVATNVAAHAEGGSTTASGMQSHAEGLVTTAKGVASHAEGWFTIAAGENQHAEGKCNIEDTENKYAHIVGNGTNADKRSNAHTLDWDGNAWYQGTIKVGGDSFDNGVEVALKTDIDNIDLSVYETKENAIETYETKEDAQFKYDTITSSKADWNQNDESAIDYIRNRPFYSTGEYEEIELLKDESTYALFGSNLLVTCPVLENKKTYKIIINDEEFICTASLNKKGNPGIGNVSYYNNDEWEDGKEPFYLECRAGSGFLDMKDSTSTSYNVSIYETKEIIHQIEKKYIEGHLAGHKAIDQEYIYEGKTYISRANAEIFNDFSNTAIGENSHAEGMGTVAFGEESHAEGYATKAIGACSHAGGTATIASGTNSFAHGNGCIASGYRAWAQNQSTEAFGDDSTAEGLGTIANRGYQHVQGTYNIPEDRVYQRVIFTMNSNSPTHDGETIVYLLDKAPTFNKVDGKYTITGNTTPIAYKDLQSENVFLFEDTTETLINKYYLVKELLETKTSEDGSTLYQWNLWEHKSQENREKGKYAHIVGNGKKSNGVVTRSNAYTLDWDGNAWFAGDVYVGGDSQDGGDKLITELELDTKLENLVTGGVTVSNAEKDAEGNVITETYETKEDADSKLIEAKQYADNAATKVKNDLLNGAGDAYDTLKELGDLIDEKQDAIAALEVVATGKADKEHTHDVYETKVDASAKLEEAKTYTDTAISSKADKEHAHDDKYDAKGSANNALESAKTYTDTEISVLSEQLAYIDVEDNENVTDPDIADLYNLTEKINQLSINVNELQSALIGVSDIIGGGE